MKSKKLNIMKTRPDISDAEIQAMMDFNKVLDGHRSAKKNGKFLKPALWITGAVVVTAFVGWMVFRPVKTPEPTVSSSINKEESAPQKTELSPATTTTPDTKPAIADKPAVIKTDDKPEPVTADVYTEAEPMGGYPDLYAYFQKELTYPAEAVKDSIEGIVSVSFVIGRNGKPEQIKILNSLGTVFDNEAMRVIGGMPEWKPASLNGKPMPARISMPLTFQIERTPKQP